MQLGRSTSIFGSASRTGACEDWATGLDELQEHTRLLNELGASRHWADGREPLMLLRADAPGLS